MHIRITYIHTYRHTHTHKYLHKHTHTYTHTHIHTYIHTYIRIYLHTYRYGEIDYVRSALLLGAPAHILKNKKYSPSWRYKVHLLGHWLLRVRGRPGTQTGRVTHSHKSSMWWLLWYIIQYVLYIYELVTLYVGQYRIKSPLCRGFMW